MNVIIDAEMMADDRKLAKLLMSIKERLGTLVDQLAFEEGPWSEEACDASDALLWKSS